jgi:hypothetical protein
MNTSVNKFVVALLGAVVGLVGEFGLDVSWAGDGMIAAVSSIVTAGLVWLIPNKEADPEVVE